VANIWTIEITVQNGTVSFRPKLPSASIGQPLGVNNGDIVIWANRTDLTLALVSIEPAGFFLANPVPPGQGSRPNFVVTTPSVKYTSMNSVHIPSQDHEIVVVGQPIA
jgi:hypothetical protein